MPNAVDNQLLMNKPMEFFRKYSVSPPSDAGQTYVTVPGRKLKDIVPNQSLSKALTLLRDDPLDRLPEGIGKIDFQKITDKKVVWIDVANVDRDKPGAKTFSISMTPGAGLVPIFFLPWASGKLMEIRLPDCGADMDNLDEFPRLFFTAALSGCSVFVDGDPAKPRIVHAGIDGKLKNTDSGVFWREMLAKVVNSSGVAFDSGFGEINKHMYMSTPEGQQFTQFLKDSHRTTMEIKEILEWASVFGIRYGRLWSFYLQHNATVSTVRVIKKAEVVKTRGSDVLKTASGLSVKKEVIKGKNFYNFDKDIYLASEDVAMPVRIAEFYPTGSARITPLTRTIVR